MADLYPGVSGSYVVNLRVLPTEAMWWRRECPVFHPYVLISYGLFSQIFRHDKQTLDEARKYLHIPDYAYVMIDSGGFQATTKHIESEHVLVWQLNNSTSRDLIVPLDYPVPIQHDNNIDLVEKLAIKTAKNIELWINKFDKLNSKSQIIIPIHGYREESLRVWWRYVKDYVEITRSVGLGGLAISKSKTLLKKSAFVETLLPKIKVALDNNVNFIHVFGVGGKFAIPYIFYLEDYLKIKFSFDTSKFSLLVAKGGIMYPSDPFKNIRKFFRRKDINDNVELPCHCPACRLFLQSKIPKISAYTHYVHLTVTLHNLFSYLAYYDKVCWLTRLGRLEKYIAKNFPEGDKIISRTKDYLEGRITFDNSIRRWL